MKKNVLWISLMMPYDEVPHAGGKIHNFYLKKIAQCQEIDVKLLTLCKPEEVEKNDMHKYNIAHEVYVRKRKGLVGTIRKGIAWLSKFCIWNQYGGITPLDIEKGVKTLLSEQIKNEAYKPDVVIMQWTEILFLMPVIKKCYPDADYVAIEEDVSFLAQERKRDYAKHWFWKNFYNIKYQKVKKLELEYLKQCQLVILNNRKDEKLVLEQDGGIATWVWAPYYQKGMKTQIVKKAKKIVFYGAMFREENWKSAIWFIENVLPRMQDNEVVFEILGGSPNKRLFQYESEHVRVRGYVEDINRELCEAECLVAPLVLGAGIKIKILEAFSCGIPVLTNHIGIEGIPAEDGKEYYHCEKPEEYVETINKIISREYDTEEVGNRAFEFMKENFNYERDAEEFVKRILAL